MALEGRRVAVVGSGITGIAAAWILHRNGAQVTLFEKDATCGGHTLTDYTSPYPVDLGFQVYNLTTYPHMVGFLDCLGVDTEPSDMSFSLSVDEGKLEWGSDSLDTIFAQRSNLASPTFLRMISDVIRFGREAPKVLDPSAHHVYRDMTLGQYLAREKYSTAFQRHYVLPMCAAVWSVPNAQVMQFPVQMLVRFWVNHHLLDIFQRPLWRVIKGRSQAYVKRVCSELPDVRTSTGVVRVDRAPEGAPSGTPPITITTDKGGVCTFDAVVLATHSDITLQLLGEGASAGEREVLGAIPYNDNDIYLHTDPSLMPRNRKVWSSWNFLGTSDPASDDTAVCVSYWVNRLQHLPPGAPEMFVTLNPLQPPAADTVIRRLSLAHPVFSGKSWEAQSRVATLQGHRATFFAGAWCGYGFHEDGIKAAVEAATAMGCSIPWVPRTTSPKVSLAQGWFMRLFDRFAAAAIRTGYLRLILPNGTELTYGDPATATTTQVAAGAGEAWRGRPAPRATLRIFDMDFFRKVVLRHDTGLGEAYMDKDFEADDLGGLLAVVVANAAGSEEVRGRLGPLNWLGDRLLYLAHKARPNTVAGSRKNIEEHYDAGNDMYKLFLDETLMYSSGLHAPGEDLHQAQLRKLDAVIDAAGLCAGDEVLEVGCGWGAFAIRAAQRTGCRVTGLTLSKEQLAEASARVAAAGLGGRVTLLFCDYRDVPGEARFDKVVSIEMIEAVGHENLPAYFGTIGRLLKPGGRAVLQAICCPDDRYDAYRASSDFIREHVFPGGHLPCIGACVEAARGTGLSLHATTDIGPHYAITLREWRRRWEEKQKEVLALGYTERFWRKFRFYFVYCEAAFDARYIHNFHLTWVKDGGSNPGGPAAAGQPGAAANATATATLTTSSGSASVPGCTSLAPPLASDKLWAAAEQLKRELPSDPLTQALLALYFFLAGILVRAHPVMWLLPAVSCACVAAMAAVRAASEILFPAFIRLDLERQGWWCANVVHLVYTCMISGASLGYLVGVPAALRLHAQPALATTPQLLVATTAGYSAFHLWVCMRGRLWARTRTPLIHYTLLLVLCGTAVYRHVRVLPFLAVALATQAASVPILATKIAELAGHHKDSPTRRTLAAMEAPCLLACRVLPHAAMTIAVVACPAAFRSLIYYVMALAGLAYLNWANYCKMRSMGLLAAVTAATAGLAQQQGGQAAAKPKAL